MKISKLQRNRGFTLIETMIAVFILVLAMNGLLGLISSSLFSARYAKNEMIANYLIQETIDSIRNDRDTIAFQNISGESWGNFINKYGTYNGSNDSIKKCYSANGCEIDPAEMPVSIVTCGDTATSPYSITCRTLNYDENANNNGFYTYNNAYPLSNFKRQVKMSVNSLPDSAGLPVANAELEIKVTVEWLNGSLLRSKAYRVSLVNWYKL